MVWLRHPQQILPLAGQMAHYNSPLLPLPSFLSCLSGPTIRHAWFQVFLGFAECAAMCAALQLNCVTELIRGMTWRVIRAACGIFTQSQKETVWASERSAEYKVIHGPTSRGIKSMLRLCVSRVKWTAAAQRHTKSRLICALKLSVLEKRWT